jgi:hypothetical protein
LVGKTPAEAARAKGVPFESWLEVVEGEKAMEVNPVREYKIELIRP